MRTDRNSRALKKIDKKAFGLSRRLFYIQENHPFLFSLRKRKTAIAKNDETVSIDGVETVSLNTGAKFEERLKNQSKVKNDVMYAVPAVKALHTIYFFMSRSPFSITAIVCRCTESPPQHKIAEIRL